MKNFILCLTIVTFTMNSFGKETVLLVSPLVQLNERELPLALSKTYKSFSNYYLQNFPKEKNVDKLLNEFETAQKYYLVKSYELARQYYENVVAFSDVDEWKDIQRKIIFLSYIRLSELNPHNETDWILQALRFSLESDPAKLGVDKVTVKKIAEVKKSFAKETIHWPVGQFKKEFSYILLNGHNIDLKKIETIKLPSGKFRLTFLSDIYKPQTYQVSSQQIPLLVPTRIPFVSGSCSKPYVNNEGEILTDVAAYYSRDCIKLQAGQKWVNSKDSSENFVPPIERAASMNSFSYNEEPFYKKSWFLITAGILGVVAVTYAINKNGEKKSTHEDVNGF